MTIGLQDLNQYNKAFALLNTNWQQTSETQRRALLHIVDDQEETRRFDSAQDNSQFVDSETLRKEVMPLFHGFDSEQVVACLNEIRDIRQTLAHRQRSFEV
jgi:hypothetical protein